MLDTPLEVYRQGISNGLPSELATRFKKDFKDFKAIY